MSYRPSDAYYKEFITASPTTGAAANADSTPVATANKNGTDDGAFTLTVTNIDTGRYKITGTVPSGYAANDIVNVTVAATCSSVAGKAVVDTFDIVAKRPGDVTQVIASVSGSVGSIASGTLIVAPSGTVKGSPAPSTTAFTVTLTNVGSLATLTGQSWEFQDGTLQGKSAIILTDTIAGSDHALTFAAAWPTAPTAGNSGVVL